MMNSLNYQSPYGTQESIRIACELKEKQKRDTQKRADKQKIACNLYLPESINPMWQQKEEGDN